MCSTAPPPSQRGALFVSASSRCGGLRLFMPAPPLPLAVWSACVLLISNSVFIVYVHSAPQCAKSSSRFGACRAVSYAVCGPHTVGVACYVQCGCRRSRRVCVGVRELLRFLSLHSSAHTSSHATRESREVVAQNPLACAALSRSRSGSDRIPFHTLKHYGSLSRLPCRVLKPYC